MAFTLLSNIIRTLTNYPMKKSVILCLWVIFISSTGLAQSTSWKGTVNANWNQVLNWTNGLPDSSKDVFVGDAHFTGSFQPKVNIASTCKSITVGSSVPVTLTLSRHLTVQNNFTIHPQATVLHPGSTIFLSGNWINDGDYRSMATSSRIIFQGINQVIGGSQISIFRRLTTNAGTNIQLQNHVVVDSLGSVLTINGTIDPGQSPMFSLTSRINNKINGTARLLVYGANFSDNFNFSGRTTFYAGSTVDYASATTDQTISNAFAYSTLIISGGSIKTLSGNLPLLYGKNNPNGKILVQAGTLDLGIFTANRAATVAGGELQLAAGTTLRLSGLNNFPANFQTRNIDLNSSVQYYGSDQTISAQQYGNLYITGSGNKNALQSFTVRGTFSMDNGNLNTGTATVTHVISGDMNMTGGTFSGANGTYEWSGPVNQQVRVNDTVPRMRINKPGGIVNLVNDVAISHALQFLQGKISTGNNKVIMHANAALSGQANNTGWVIGNMKRFVPTGNAQSVDFAIGTQNSFAPVSLLFQQVSSSGYVMARADGADHSAIDYSGIDDAHSVNINWTVQEESLMFTQADASFGWQDPDLDAGANTAIFKSGLYNGSAWTILTSANQQSNSITANNLVSFGQFAVGEKLGRHIWHGNAMTNNWFDPMNWRGGLPDASVDAEIPSTLQPGRQYPVLTGQTGQVKDIVVQTGASLLVQNGTLNIAGAIDNDGILQAAEGTIGMNGSNPQSIPDGAFTGNKIMNLQVQNNLSLLGTDTITGTLTLYDGKTLETNNNLVLKSTANGTARIAPLPVDGSGNATAFINGQVSIERFIPARKAWRLLSAPIANGMSVSINQAWQESSTNQNFGPGDPNPGYGVHITGGIAANGFDQSPTNSASMKVYRASSNSFINLPANPGTYAPIGSYTGYMLYIRGNRGINLNDGNNAAVTSTTLRVKGTVNTGNKTYPVNASGFTVFGNPYASAINFETLTKNNVKNTFYIWDPKLSGSNGLGGYVTASWNSQTMTYDFTASASPVSQYIPSGEAILIESADGSNPGSITVKESDKTDLGSDQWFGRQARRSRGIDIRLMEAGGNALLDAALVQFDDQYLQEAGPDDAGKLPADAESISLLRSGKDLSIERRKMPKAGDSLHIQMQHLKPATYTLELVLSQLSNLPVKAFIYDRYTMKSVSIPMSDESFSYQFTVDRQEGSSRADRLLVVFGDPAPVPAPNAELLPIVRTEQQQANGSITVFPNPVMSQDVSLRLQDIPNGPYHLRLMNHQGQVVFSSRYQHTQGKSAQVRISLPSGLAPGVYELSLENGAWKKTTSMVKP